MHRILLILVFALGSIFASFPIHAQDAAPQANPETQVPVPIAGDPLYAPVAISGKPQNLHDKFIDYAILAVGPRTLFAPAVFAAARMNNPPAAYPREWRMGAGAFGRNYGNGLAVWSCDGNREILDWGALARRFSLQAVDQQQSTGSNFSCLGIYFRRQIGFRSQPDRFCEFPGAEAGGFVGNLYMPAGFNNLSHAETRTAIAFGSFAAQNLLREFVPTLLKATQKWHTPFPRIPVPEWWVKLSPR